MNPKGLGSAVYSYLEDIFQKYAVSSSVTGVYDVVIKEVEKALIDVALTHTQGNQTKASELLGINRNTLRRKIKDHAA